MSIYGEIVNEYAINPTEIDKILWDGINEKFEPWDLPEIDILDLWGRVDLRTAFGLLSGGDTPTTYSKRMADMMRVLTGPSLLGLDEEPVDAEFTQALRVLESIREPVDAEVIDELE